MPTYDYQCRTCGHRFEYFQSMSSDVLTQCPLDLCAGSQEQKGKGDVTRRVSGGAGLVFKGEGFYLTDYVRKSGEGESKGAATSEKSEKSERSERSEKMESSEKSEKTSETKSSSGEGAKTETKTSGGTSKQGSEGSSASSSGSSDSEGSSPTKSSSKDRSSSGKPGGSTSSGK